MILPLPISPLSSNCTISYYYYYYYISEIEHEIVANFIMAQAELLQHVHTDILHNTLRY